MSADAEDVGEPVPCAVVAVSNGAGIRDIFRSLGVRRVVAGGQSMNPSTADLLAAVEAVPADEVLILPNNGNIIAVAEQVDAQTSKTIRVVPTRGITEGFASLLEYDPRGTADGNLAGMAAAAATVVAGEVTVAVRNSDSDAGEISEGDHLGLSGGKVMVVADSAFDATTGLLAQMVDDSHEIVTLIAGLDAAEATTAAIVSWLEAEHPGVEVEVHEGGQPLYPYFLGVE
jgi:dihydroxyacetone kinase-like predicted kinase